MQCLAYTPYLMRKEQCKNSLHVLYNTDFQGDDLIQGAMHFISVLVSVKTPTVS